MYKFKLTVTGLKIFILSGIVNILKKITLFSINAGKSLSSNTTVCLSRLYEAAASKLCTEKDRYARLLFIIIKKRYYN